MERTHSSGSARSADLPVEEDLLNMTYEQYLERHGHSIEFNNGYQQGPSQFFHNSLSPGYGGNWRARNAGMGFPEDQYSDYVSNWYTRQGPPMGRDAFYDAGAAEQILELKRLGYLVVLVTGSLDFLMEPLAEELGADYVYAAKLFEENGRFTGRLQGMGSANDEKAERIWEYAKMHGVSLRERLAFGDSIADIPMLEVVSRSCGRFPTSPFIIEVMVPALLPSPGSSDTRHRRLCCVNQEPVEVKAQHMILQIFVREMPETYLFLALRAIRKNMAFMWG